VSTRALAKGATLLALAGWAGAALGMGAADLAAQMHDCSAITGRNERLACFDRVAATLNAVTATTGPGATAAPATAAKSAPRVAPAVAAAATAADPQARFGFSATQIEQAREDQEPANQPLQSLTARVSGARRVGNGGWLITLDNGQVWRQVAPSESLDPVAGSSVTIKPASFGSFLMVDGSRHSARVHREQ
jgi:hypothetical protein